MPTATAGGKGWAEVKSKMLDMAVVGSRQAASNGLAGSKGGRVSWRVESKRGKGIAGG